MDMFTLERGTAPLLISLPHDGSHIPESLRARMLPSAQAAPDTDWHVSQLYAFARELGASILRPHHSRYVVDLNRPPDDVSLYPGQNTTGLCPQVQFSGEPVYLPGQAPSPEEIFARVTTYWQPYHAALQEELARLRRLHERVVLWEGHSIRGELPFLFEGQLPDLNLGTVNGGSCSPAMQARLEAVLAAQSDYSHIVNGRFKGGYITRHYGNPAAGIDAVQLELAQRSYMDETSTDYLPERAERLHRTVLRPLLEAAIS
ncbi:N-formylglutamate deformylase [Xanthomonadaceae bacterium JHOS43]|nr:N-formylglutamate deformylase [Xanthomonadaceae bacterium JHOS43]